MAAKIDNNKEMSNQKRISSSKDILKYGQEEKEKKENISLLLIGKTGEGKSETANTILGENLCKASDAMTSCTDAVERYTRASGDYSVTVVDAPGCADTKIADNILDEIAKAITLVPDGYDAFLIVVKYPLRWTQEAAKVIKQLETLFGKEFYRYCIVIFTHGDNFATKMKVDKSTKTFEDYVQNQNINMGNLLQRVEYRTVLFDNMKARETPNYRQELVHNLLEQVHKIKTKEHGLYDNRLFQKARELQREYNDAGTVIGKLVGYMNYLLGGWCSIS